MLSCMIEVAFDSIISDYYSFLLGALFDRTNFGELLRKAYLRAVVDSKFKVLSSWRSTSDFSLDEKW